MFKSFSDDDNNLFTSESNQDPDRTLIHANGMLREKYGIYQTTVQVEAWQPVMDDCQSCQVPEK